MENSYYFDKLDILLVDDRDENLLSLEAALACPGYNLIKLRSGDEVLRHLLTRTPALILMDVQMPGLNGFEAAAIIKKNERTRDIPIIFITAINKDERFVYEGYEHGAVDYIYKPYDVRILKSRVAVFAEARRGQRRISQLVAVQRASTEALAGAANVQEAVSKVLRAVCTSVGWDLGAFWRVNRQLGSLQCQAEWHEPGDGASVFRELGRARQLFPNEDLPGQAWVKREALWVADLAKEHPDSKRLKAAVAGGIETLVAIPVRVQDEILGVLEVCSRKRLALDTDLVNVMGAIGSQIGQVLKRTEAFERLRANESLLEFLVEAGTALASSLNYDETVATVANLAVRSLADWCSIVLAPEGQPERSITVVHRDPAKLSLVDRLNKRIHSNLESLLGVSNVIQTGKSELYSVIPENQEHLAATRELGLKSAMVVPFVVREKIWGAITLVSSESAHRYTKEDLLVAEELVRRAAVAIENAKLYRDAQDAILVRDEFFSIASHELKTPITSLKLLLHLTQRAVKRAEGAAPPTEKITKMLDTSSRQVDHLTRLVEDLLDITKIRAGKLTFHFEELDLSELTKELVERYSSEISAAQCPLEISIEPNVLGVWDRTRIEQVLMNLISNAIKYAPGAPIGIKVSSQGGMARISVQDCGPGIARDQQGKIFERFERVVSSPQIGGLGLGLFIAKQIVEGHNGTIRIESEPRKGSTFIVELPAKAEASLQRVGSS